MIHWGRKIEQVLEAARADQYQTSFTLVLPLRRLVLSPEELADRLHLTGASQVLEIGPGLGYFGVKVARRLSQGRLELLDLQREMLEKARRKIERAGLRNVGFTQGDACNLPYSEDQFDVVFLVAVLGETPHPAACLESIHRTLRLGGLLSITEQPGDPDFMPLPIVRALAEQQGFRFVESCGRGKNYTANFVKRAQNDSKSTLVLATAARRGCRGAQIGAPDGSIDQFVVDEKTSLYYLLKLSSSRHARTEK